MIIPNTENAQNKAEE
jgi:calpain